MRDRIPRQNQQVAYRVIDGSAVLVSPEDSALYWLNPVASRIWELVDGTRTVAAIAGALCEDYEVELATALRDVETMVAAFVDKDFLVLPSAATPGTATHG